MRRILPVTSEQPLYDIATTRAIEALAAAPLEPYALMARAGEAVARLALAVAPHACSVWIVAGPGNNGGDGLEAAVHLQRAGKQVSVSLLADPDTLPADARTALDRAQAAAVLIILGATSPTHAPDLAIDALLGIGVSRAPQGAMAEVIAAFNALRCPRLAVDVPSGLNADTGQPLGTPCVIADHTLAMLTLKPGLFTGSGRDHAGEVWLDDLRHDAASSTPTSWLSGVIQADRPAPRRHAQHKGSFGDVAVVAGGLGMSGAAVLAARAAHAAGAGRVFVEMLDRSGEALAIDLLHPELMFRRDWSRSAPDVLQRSTVVCGCGGGDAVCRVLPRLLHGAGRLVLDADALNAVSTDAALARLLHGRAERGAPTVLTPHPLEASRLLGCSTTDIQADRLQAAHALAQRHAAVVVLKGSGTVVSAPGQTPRVNGTGNGSLATAGTGDVLAGWLGGRWAQLHGDDEAETAFAAACRAVAEHGAAAEPPPDGALLASDLIERLHRR